jgi:hypothetical protein
VSGPPDPRRYVRYEVRFSAQLNASGQLQTCPGEDLGAGGCRVVMVFPLQRGQLVRLRLRADAISLEISGQATVAWVSRDPPYRCGLQFSDDLAEQAVKFIHALLGPVRLTKGPS